MGLAVSSDKAQNKHIMELAEVLRNKVKTKNIPSSIPDVKIDLRA